MHYSKVHRRMAEMGHVRYFAAQKSSEPFRRLIRRWVATDAAAYEAVVCAKACSTRPMWADTAHRSAANETFLNKNGFVSHIHRKKPKGRAMPETMRRANNAKSKSARLSSMYSPSKKDRMGLFIRTIEIARATT